MKICQDVRSQIYSSFLHGVVLIGNFDGCHLGHQVLIQRAKRWSQKLQAPWIVWTFFPHPKMIFKKENGFLIMSREEKHDFFKQIKCHHLIEQKLDLDFLSICSKDFLETFLISKLKPQVVIVGENFRFGAKRSGNAWDLKKICQQRGVLSEVVPSVLLEGQVISSSWIREQVLNGSVEKARKGLGRAFFVTGNVQKGAQRGRALGTPTLNIVFAPQKITPPFGVYVSVVQAKNDPELFPAISHFGVRPTFGETKPVLETHLLFEKHSPLGYGSTIAVSLLKKIRLEKKFPSSLELQSQIQKDCQMAKAFFCHS